MKRIFIAVIAALTSLVSSTGCVGMKGKTTEEKVTAILPYVRPAATTASFLVLKAAVNDANRARIANELKIVAGIVERLAVGKAPTALELRNAIMAFDPAAQGYANIAVPVQVVYELYYADLMSNDPDVNLMYATKILREIAAGCRDAAELTLTQPLAP